MPLPEVTPPDVDALLDAAGRERRNIVDVLLRIQDRYQHLPVTALRQVAATSAISPADLEGVSSFYPRFRSRAAGRHTIRVCVGTACYVKGGEIIHDAIRQALRLGADADTDRDGLFTVERAACLGCCMLAPVVQIDGAVYGHLTRDTVPAVLRDFLSSRAAAGDPGPSGTAKVGVGRVAMCTCTSCRASGAGAVYETFSREAAARRLGIEIHRSGCSGISYRAPVIELRGAAGESARYAGIVPADVPGILDRHFRARGAAAGARRAVGRFIDRFLGGSDRAGSLSLDLEAGPDAAFWEPQVRIATAESAADPLDLDGYLAEGGFSALRRCRDELGPTGTIELVRASGLRGRGGAGYPTAAKWEDTAAAPGDLRVVICNADEGDPGAFMDRLVLESYPYRVIEGLAIAACAVGSDSGIFYVRAEYPLAISRVREALERCRERGVLGTLAIEVAQGAGAFVCGEETAMIAALEGRRGVPRARPPYPSRAGLEGRPTLVNNVETLAALPWIVARGADAFRAIGTPRSPGTKTFALAGKIVRGGLIEVPMGTTIRRIVEEIGGGVQDGHCLKAVQVGGPSGGCIPAHLADLPVDYESLSEAGAMMGSGGMVVLDETDCMVDVACYFMDFTRHESCGTCAPSGSARPACMPFSPHSARAPRSPATSSGSRTSPSPLEKAASAASVGPRPAPCCPPCGTSEQSTRITCVDAARPNAAGR